MGCQAAIQLCCLPWREFRLIALARDVFPKRFSEFNPFWQR